MGASAHKCHCWRGDEAGSENGRDIGCLRRWRIGIVASLLNDPAIGSNLLGGVLGQETADGLIGSLIGGGVLGGAGGGIGGFLQGMLNKAKA